MSVANGQKADATTFNDAFVSKTVDSEVQAIITLNDPIDPNSGNAVDNVQQAINEIFGSVGMSGTGDTTKDDYSSQNYVTNGDDRKAAIGKLDTQLKIVSDAIPVGGGEGQVLAKRSTTDFDTQWVSVSTLLKASKSYTDFQTAATTVAITAVTLAEAALLKSVVLKHSTAFAGTSITAVTVSVGVSGDAGKFINEFDVLQATGDTVFEMDMVNYIGSFGSTTDILITMTAVGANLSALTAGALDIFFDAMTIA